MKRNLMISFAIVAALILFMALKVLFFMEWDQTKGATSGPVHLLATIALPDQPLTDFDVSWVDASRHRYYLADRSNAGLDVIDTASNRFLTRITGFAGVNQVEKDLGGPNGVFARPDTGDAWAGDGNSQVQVAKLAGDVAQTIATIKTGGEMHVDEMAYDPEDQIVIVANEADTPPFLTLISARDHSIVGRLELPEAWVGIEQPVWNPDTHSFLISIPLRRGILHQLGALLFGAGLAGEIISVDPKTAKIVSRIPTDGCIGTGLALGPRGHLIQGCYRRSRTMIIDATTGRADVITEAGGADEVTYNPGDGRYYVAAAHNRSGPVLTIIDAKTNAWLQNVQTADKAKSVAVDSSNGHAFIPLSPNTLAFDNDKARGLSCDRGCIGVYGEK